MGSDTKLVEIIIQTGLTPALVIALLVTGWLVTKRHLDDTAKRGDEYRELFETERQEHQRTRDENRRIMGEMAGTLAGFGTTLDRMLYRMGHDDDRGTR